MGTVAATVISGDGTFTLNNGATSGRAVVALALQGRNPPNLTGLSIDGVDGTTYGQQTTTTGERTLAVVWTDSELPTSAGDYSITRLPNSTAGGTTYTVVELSLVNSPLDIEVISNAVATLSDPLTLSFSNAADAYLGVSFRTDAQGGSNIQGSGVDYFQSTIEYIGGEDTTASNDSVSVSSFNGSSEVAYTGVAIATAASPALTINDPIIPGTTTTFSTTDFVDPLTGVRITDAQGNIKELTLTSQTSVSTPAVGDLAYALFGDVTLEVYNATESAEATIAFDPPAGFNQIALEAGFATDQESFLYQYGGTPAVPDQFTYDPIASGTGETLTLQTNGYWTATGYGEWTVYAIDATDGYMEPFQFIWNEAAATGIIGLKVADRVRSIIGKSLTGKSL